MKRWFDRNMGWCVAHVLAIVLAIFVVLQLDRYETISAAFCATKDTNCIRDWLGALSGWVGAAVAGATIAFLARQIKESERQHAARHRRDLQRSIALARRCIAQADLTQYYVGRIIEINDAFQPKPHNTTGERHMLKLSLSLTLTSVVNCLSDECLSRFESDVGLDHYDETSQSLIQRLKGVETVLSAEEDIAPTRLRKMIEQIYTDIGGSIKKYSTNLERSAKHHISEMENELKALHPSASPPA